MRAIHTQKWYIPLIRGIFSLLFGLTALLLPGLTLVALIYVFAAYALADGAVSIYEAFSNRDAGTNWGWGLIEGIIGLLAGVGAVFVPQLAGLTLLFLIAFYAMFTGVMQIIVAVQLRKEIENEAWMGLAGLVSVVFGAFVLFDPLGGALATAWVIGIYALTFGAMMIALSFRLRGDDNLSQPERNIPVGSNA